MYVPTVVGIGYIGFLPTGGAFEVSIHVSMTQDVANLMVKHNPIRRTDKLYSKCNCTVYMCTVLMYSSAP